MIEKVLFFSRYNFFVDRGEIIDNYRNEKVKS